MSQETQLINEKDYRFKTLIGYTNELKERKNEVRKSFKNNKNKFNRISVANYSVSSITVGSAIGITSYYYRFSSIWCIWNNFNYSNILSKKIS